MASAPRPVRLPRRSRRTALGVLPPPPASLCAEQQRPSETESPLPAFSAAQPHVTRLGFLSFLPCRPLLSSVPPPILLSLSLSLSQTSADNDPPFFSRSRQKRSSRLFVNCDILKRCIWWCDGGRDGKSVNPLLRRQRGANGQQQSVLASKARAAFSAPDSLGARLPISAQTRLL